MLSLVIAIAVLGVSAGAMATIPDSKGVIHACFNPQRSGSLRVINTDKGQTCTSNEKQLNWNQRGRRGPAGADGTTVVDRIRWTGDYQLRSQVEQTTTAVYQWTQGPHEIDKMIPGTITVVLPDGCQGTQLNYGVYLWVDVPTEGGPMPLEIRAGGGSYISDPQSTVVTVPMDGEGGTLFESDAEVTRTIQMTGWAATNNACAMGTRVVAVSLDVVAIR
jgi:hypothetical protein